MRRAVFLDRDGVINEMVHRETNEIDSPQHPSEFCLRSGVVEAIRTLNQWKVPVVVVSNQPGIAKGKSTLARVEGTTARLHESLGAGGAWVDAVYYCFHHPSAALEAYRVVCECRKPRPGLLKQASLDLNLALEGSYMIGDRLTDVQAGQSVGCVTILVRSADDARAAFSGDPGAAQPDFRCDDLFAAVNWICERETNGLLVDAKGLEFRVR